MSDTNRNLLDDRSSLHNDPDSMNDTMTRLGENNSILNMSDGRVKKIGKRQDVVIEEPSNEDVRVYSKGSRSRASYARRSQVSGKSFRTLSNENNLSPKSQNRDESPLRSSIGGSKKQYDVIYGDAQKIYPNGIPTPNQINQRESSEFDLTNKSYKLNTDLKRVNSPSDIGTNPTRGTQDHTALLTGIAKQESDQKQA